MFRGTHGTNQNFIARPVNADIDSTGCQDESLPQALNHLVTSAQLEYINEGRNNPESNLHGTGLLWPEQLGELAEFSHVASVANLQSEACRRTQGHATQESQVAAADLLQNAGSLETGARPPDLG